MAKKYFLFLLMFSMTIQASVAQTVTGSFTYDGLLRDYRVHLPPGYNSFENLPLVFNLHGFGSNAIQEEAYTQLDQVADTARFIAVYPNGVNNTWDISGGGVDDVGFLSALIDTIDAQYNIDLSRVYSCGMSMGGYMSYRLACELTCRIAAIASVTGALATFPCDPSRPIPVMQIHGTADTTVPYSLAAPTIQAWLQKNNCPTTPLVTNLPDINTADNCTATKDYYGLCDDSTEVILYTINGGEHTWPDAFIDIGVTNKDFNASETIWGFLKKYRLKNEVLIASGCDTIPVVSSVFSMDAQKINHRIYPNPSLGEITIKTDVKAQEVITFYLFDVFGKEVKRQEMASQFTNITTDELAPGVYFYRISNTDGIRAKGKVIIL